jgi:hypothetical protein
MTRVEGDKKKNVTKPQHLDAGKSAEVIEPKKQAQKAAQKPVPKVAKAATPAVSEKDKKKVSPQGLAQQDQTDMNENEEVETSAEVNADDFDSESKSVHSLGQRSRLVDNAQDDADKYDFADNYQQTEDDVNADALSEKQYVQSSDSFDKDSDDVYEEDK